MKSYRVIILFLLIAICTFPIDAKKKKYPNGDVYEGEWKNNMPEGNGTMTYVNGDIYSGSWHLGKKNGTGIYTYSEGDRYEGSWLDDIRNGQGLLTYKNGEAELLAIWDHGEIRDGTITYQGKKYYGATGETCGTKSITGPDYTFIGTWRDFMPYSGTETVTYRKYPNSVTTSTEYSNGSITKVSAKYGIYNIEGEKFEEGFPAGNAVLTYSDYIINGVFFPTDDGVEFTICDF